MLQETSCKKNHELKEKKSTWYKSHLLTDVVDDFSNLYPLRVSVLLEELCGHWIGHDVCGTAERREVPELKFGHRPPENVQCGCLLEVQGLGAVYCGTEIMKTVMERP